VLEELETAEMEAKMMCWIRGARLLSPGGIYLLGYNRIASSGCF